MGIVVGIDRLGGIQNNGMGIHLFSIDAVVLRPLDDRLTRHVFIGDMAVKTELVRDLELPERILKIALYMNDELVHLLLKGGLVAVEASHTRSGMHVSLIVGGLP